MSQITSTTWIWKNGALVPWESATLHVMSHVVHYGSSVFEGIRCYATPHGPALFRLDEHIRRLHDSARIYRLTPPYSPAQLAAACCALVQHNGLEECYLRPIVLRGLGAPGVSPLASPIDTYIICWPWGAYLGEHALERGVHVRVASWFRPARNTLPALAKAGGTYLSSQLIKMEALADGYDEGIALGPDGLVSEGSSQNLFLVRDGTLITPPVDGTMLAGITRDSVITVARELGVPVQERCVPREQLYTADEAFFTGTAAEVTPISSIDRVPVGNGTVGRITRAVQGQLLAVMRGQAPDTHGWLTHARRMAQAEVA
jgi:branched-chain amino acid aminotransferase